LLLVWLGLHSSLLDCCYWHEGWSQHISLSPCIEFVMLMCAFSLFLVRLYMVAPFCCGPCRPPWMQRSTRQGSTRRCWTMRFSRRAWTRCAATLQSTSPALLWAGIPACFLVMRYALVEQCIGLAVAFVAHCILLKFLCHPCSHYTVKCQLPPGAVNTCVGHSGCC
jgi:hypothetical protein